MTKQLTLSREALVPSSRAPHPSQCSRHLPPVTQEPGTDAATPAPRAEAQQTPLFPLLSLQWVSLILPVLVFDHVSPQQCLVSPGDVSPVRQELCLLCLAHYRSLRLEQSPLFTWKSTQSGRPSLSGFGKPSLCRTPLFDA